MDIVDLVVKPRTGQGTRAARGLRRQGGIPGILYGHGMKPLSLEVNARLLNKVLHTKAGGNVVINLKVEGTKLKESTCLVKDIQQNPVTDEIAHVDFTVISLTEKIKVQVPIVIKNMEEAVGVKEGGILDVVHHEIEVECLPTEIPGKIEVDVKEMKIGDAVHVKDLAVSKKIALQLGEDEVVVALHPPQKEEAAPAEGEAAMEPEVIEKGKKEEAEGEEAPAKAAEAPKAEKKK